MNCTYVVHNIIAVLEEENHPDATKETAEARTPVFPMLENTGGFVGVRLYLHPARCCRSTTRGDCQTDTVCRCAHLDERHRQHARLEKSRSSLLRQSTTEAGLRLCISTLKSLRVHLCLLPPSSCSSKILLRVSFHLVARIPFRARALSFSGVAACWFMYQLRYATETLCRPVRHCVLSA